MKALNLPDATQETIYITDYAAQVCKEGNTVCGDYYKVVRAADYTFAVLCDGIGTGIKANIAARIFAARAQNLVASRFLQSKTNIAEIFERIVSDMEKARASKSAFSALSIAIFLPEGNVSIFSYRMPQALILKQNLQEWQPIKFKNHTAAGTKFQTAQFTINYGDAVCLSSGALGTGINLTEVLNSMTTTFPVSSMANMLVDRLSQANPSVQDDATAMILYAKKPEVLHILTGVSKQKDNDAHIVNKFLALNGQKVICGSTTMDVFCRVTDLKASINTSFYADFIPPEYSIDGITLATEGAITLNQCNNILFDDFFKDKFDTAPEKLANLLRHYDIINFIVGTAENTSHDTAEFKQMGIMPRREVVLAIIEKLKKRGNIVLIEYV